MYDTLEKNLHFRSFLLFYSIFRCLLMIFTIVCNTHIIVIIFYSCKNDKYIFSYIASFILACFVHRLYKNIFHFSPFSVFLDWIFFSQILTKLVIYLYLYIVIFVEQRRGWTKTKKNYQNLLQYIFTVTFWYIYI